MEGQPPSIEQPTKKPEPKVQSDLSLTDKVRIFLVSTFITLGLVKGSSQSVLVPDIEADSPPTAQPGRTVISSETHQGTDQKGPYVEQQVVSSQGPITNTEIVTSITKTYDSDPKKPLISEILSPLEGPPPQNTPDQNK